ncbi:hypothetical protein L914_19636 [Phytophthora nicotianae]|uniref:Uncharacterized protein n=2 Tax=Phytophthora nicotianae TaxID=4792 RepID=V9E1L4_PHYNI|nr:hypothetical protein F443_20417 [Phytophthora nicotianae P1569]ETM33089.1 hypothetical protein L914_19636 [Phytophthora nicotianae]
MPFKKEEQCDLVIRTFKETLSDIGLTKNVINLQTEVEDHSIVQDTTHVREEARAMFNHMGRRALQSRQWRAIIDNTKNYRPICKQVFQRNEGMVALLRQHAKDCDP